VAEGGVVRHQKGKPWRNCYKVCVLDFCSQLYAENREVAFEDVTKLTSEVTAVSDAAIYIDNA
jgi:hypothetical protein